MPSGGMPPCSVLCSSLLLCSPASNQWLKGPVGWNLAGASNVVEVWSDKKPGDTQRSGELRFYFDASGFQCLPVSEH
jgi:hypothetical protein